ncbi:MAG: DUF2125 domain-containing protein [Paracoccaceae bacterium]
MRHWKLAGSTAMLALIAGGSAWADVTPEQVWQNWQEMSKSYGQTLTAASTERQGDTLVVQGLELRAEQPEIKASGKIDKVNFRDKGDGTVEITMSDSYPLTIEFLKEGKQEATAHLQVSAPGLIMTAAGTTDETSYDFNAPNAAVTLQSIDSEDAAAKTATFDMAMTGLSGKYLVGPGTGEGKMVQSSVSADQLSLQGGAQAPDGKFALTATVAQLSGSSSGNFLGAAAMADPGAALRAGFAVDGTFSYGATKFDMDVEDKGKPAKIAGSATGGDFNVAMDKGRLVYGGGGKGVNMSITSAEIPFPINVAYSEGAFNLLMPVSKTDAPADFAFLTKLVDLTVSEEIWALIDPGKTLPRDPATVIIDTKGTATLSADLMDEAAMKALGDAPPGELHSLDINALQASIAGAQLNGTGALTFDNSDKVTFGGAPAPTGKVDLKLTGGNGLLDKLVALGLVPQDTAMQVRMMTAMFSKPGAGADELTSEIEFKDKGFFVNGQRLQ